MLLFSRSVLSEFLWPYGLQHRRLACPLPSPGVCSNSCPLNWWCYPTILFSVTLFSSAFNFSQNQGIFQWVGSSRQVAKVLEFHHQLYPWTFRGDFFIFLFLFLFFLTFYFYFILLYNTVLVLPYIDMNPPRFRIDWFDLLAVQGTIKRFLQNHSSKALTPRSSAFFTVQPSHP